MNVKRHPRRLDLTGQRLVGALCCVPERARESGLRSLCEMGSGQGGKRKALCATAKWPQLLLKCCFTSTETVGLLGTGAQDVHHIVQELCQ